MLQKKIVLLAVILLSVFGCSNAVKTSFSEINITSKNNSIVEVYVPSAKGTKTVANKINSAIDQQIAKSLKVGDPDQKAMGSAEESISKFNEEFKQFKNDFPETEIPWEAQIDGEVLFQSPEIISVAITSYVNTGGAHGITNVSFLNFDAITGDTLSNAQLITDMETFKKFVEPYFEQTVAEKETVIFEAEEFILPANMAYTEDGFVLLYNTYEIGPYSSGIIEFAIPFDEAQPYLAFNHL